MSDKTTQSGQVTKQKRRKKGERARTRPCAASDKRERMGDDRGRKVIKQGGQQ